MFEEIYRHSSAEEDNEGMSIFSIEEEEDHKDEQYPEAVPVIALKNTVLFPGVVIPINIGRKKSVQAVQKAYQDNKWIGVIAQKDPNQEEPAPTDLYPIGTLARVVKILKMPDGSNTAILQGRRRLRMGAVVSETPFLLAHIELLDYAPVQDKLEFKALISSIRDLSKRVIELSPQIPNEAVIMLKNISSDGFLLNFIASNMGIKVETKQTMLETHDLTALANLVLTNLHQELQLLELRDQIESKVRVDIEKQQRDYFLNQQLKTIQEELGQNPQEEELRNLERRGKNKKWPKETAKVFERELVKARRTNPQIGEYSVILNYLELLLDLPWQEYTKDNFDLKKVQKVLDQDHYGLEKVKERILEHLAVLKLKGDMKAPILCLVGPPGVGKTSLGKSIARALKRKFVRISLGGLHDESEIRGHRKTYIGAMPGRIIQSLKKAQSGNPVFVLDEIDKIGNDYKGDPSSALLEVLDPEQNSAFYDNYLEMEYDLSKVLFIATSNSLNTIQPALLDRMEIIDLSGYSLEEKVEIAQRHLVPKQLAEHGITKAQVKLSNPAVAHLVQDYTREAGVRSLERRVAGVFRNVAKKIAMKEEYPKVMKPEHLEKILGPARFRNDLYQEKQPLGVAIGLAWTKVGGEILFIESSLYKGKGKLSITGSVGDVMRESATTALSFLKANCAKFNIDYKLFDAFDIHIHIPEGAIPKDGPSAGITMLSSLTSLFGKKPVKPYLAMTGEITLRGRLLAVGGIKEKVLAAKRAGLKEILLSEDNKKDVDQIPSDYLAGLTFQFFARMEDALAYALS